MRGSRHSLPIGLRYCSDDNFKSMKPLLIVIGLTLVTFTSPAYPHERDSISDGLTDELLRPASEVSDMDNAPGVFKIRWIWEQGYLFLCLITGKYPT